MRVDIVLVNTDITNEKVRIVGDEFKDKGVIDLEEALNIADEQGLDLVEMSVSDGVSVCKIMNYSKFLYEQKKSKKVQKKSVLKEIKFGCNIADHDLSISANKALKIMNSGDKVKVMAIFKGRQAIYGVEQGESLMNRFMSHLPDDVVISKSGKFENSIYSIIVERKIKK